MSKNAAKFRKSREDYDYGDAEFYHNHNKKKESIEVKRSKNKISSQFRNLSYREVMDAYGSEDDWT